MKISHKAEAVSAGKERQEKAEVHELPDHKQLHRMNST